MDIFGATKYEYKVCDKKLALAYFKTHLLTASHLVHKEDKLHLIQVYFKLNKRDPDDAHDEIK